MLNSTQSITVKPPNCVKDWLYPRIGDWGHAHRNQEVDIKVVRYFVKFSPILGASTEQQLSSVSTFYAQSIGVLYRRMP